LFGPCQDYIKLILVVQLSQLRAAVVRSEKMVAEAGDSLGTQRKGNITLEMLREFLENIL
jgi:hypothetical protein